MQCSDDARLLLRRKHRPRKNGRCRVGHGIVNMEYVQPVIAAHFRHLYGEWQRVIGVLEQIVVVDDHWMKMQAWSILGQTERPLVADEMHLMAAPRQLLAQRGGEDAASSHRG